MAWDLFSNSPLTGLKNYHLDHNDKVVYVYMEVLRENSEGELIEKTDWYPPEEYDSPYYFAPPSNGPLTRYEPRVKTQSYEMGIYPDLVNVSFQTVKINGVNEEYKVTFVNARMLELIREGKSFVEARDTFLSEWTGPPAPEWTPDMM